MTNSELIELTLPNHWAPALINGDTTGLEYQDLKTLNDFMEYELPGLHCLDVKDDSEFVKYHDAQQYVRATDCSTYTFMQLTSDYDAN